MSGCFRGLLASVALFFFALFELRFAFFFIFEFLFAAYASSHHGCSGGLRVVICPQ